jgi:hypothetical protein
MQCENVGHKICILNEDQKNDKNKGVKKNYKKEDLFFLDQRRRKKLEY